MDAVELWALVDESLADTRLGQVSVGLNKARCAFAQANLAGLRYVAAAALAAQAEAEFRFGHYPEALELAGQAEQSALVLIDPQSAENTRTSLSIRALAHLVIGRCYGETYDLKASESHLTRAVELSRSAGDTRLLLRGLHSISAGLYMPRGQYALALSTDEEVLALAHANHLCDELERPLITMSWVCLLTGQTVRSAELLAELQGVVRPDNLGDGWAHCIQGWLHVRADNLLAADKEFRRTRAIGEAIGSPELNFFGRLGLAAVCRLNEDLGGALDWAMDALEIANRIRCAHFQGMAWLECGRCAWQQRRLEAAGLYFEDALEVSSTLPARLEMALAYLGLAAVWLERKQPQAMAAIRQAMEFISTNDFTFLFDQERSLAYPVAAAGLRSRDKSLVKLAARLVEELEQVPPLRLRVQALGGLRVWQGHRALPPRSLNYRRAGELLVLLLSSANYSLAVETAAENLSPERSPQAALEILHQAASALRRALEPDLPARFPSRSLRVENGIIQFLWPQCDPPEDCLDFVAFRQAYACQQWEAALDLYRGDFMCEVPFTDWAIAWRQQYASLYQRALLEAARARQVAGDDLGALDLCRRLHKIEPWHEEAVLLGMQTALACGDSAAARRLYHSLEKSLRDDLGETPQAELRALYHSISG